MKCCSIFIITNGSTSSLLTRKMEHYTGIGQAATWYPIDGELAEPLHLNEQGKESSMSGLTLHPMKEIRVIVSGEHRAFVTEMLDKSSDGVHDDRQRVGKGPSRRA